MLTAILTATLTLRALTADVGVRDVQSYIDEHQIPAQGRPIYYLPGVIECSVITTGTTDETAITMRHYYGWTPWHTAALLDVDIVDGVSDEQTFQMVAEMRLQDRGLWTFKWR